MKPFFFGSSQRQLFGVYHAPGGQAARDESVLLCYPGVQEYNVTHWAFRRLAAMLARDGFHVLRFDWSGSGDSAGDAHTACFADWLEDVTVAAQELRANSSAGTLSVVGMRLGAAIATLASADKLDVRNLVLWEPVVSGSRYVEELEDHDAAQTLTLLHELPATRNELLGYPFPRKLRGEITNLDLRRTSPCRAERVTMFASESREEHRAFRDALAAADRDVGYVQVSEDASAANAGERQAALLSNKVLVAIAKHLGGASA